MEQDELRRRKQLLKAEVSRLRDQGVDKYGDERSLSQLKRLIIEGKGPDGVVQSTFENLMRTNVMTPLPPERAWWFMAKEWNLTAAERNRLLQLAGLLPVVSPVGTGDDESKISIPDDVLNRMQRRLHMHQWPAFAINQMWDVLDVNEHFCRLLDVPNDFLYTTIQPKRRNSLLLIFEHGYPIRKRLTVTPEAWQTIAATNIRAFKVFNEPFKNQPWYKNRVAELLSLNRELAAMWEQVDIYKPVEGNLGLGQEGGAPMAYVVPFNTAGHRVETKSHINLAPGTNPVSTGSNPLIFFYIPDDDDAVEWFKQIGIIRN